MFSTLSTLSITLFTLLTITIQLIYSFPNELNRLHERNRGFVVRLDEEDFPKVAKLILKYDCHSLYSVSAPCNHIIGSGFEQFFTTTPTPPHSFSGPSHTRPLLTKHVASTTSTLAQDLIVEALSRQYKQQQDEFRQQSLTTAATTLIEMDQMNNNNDDTSLFDLFQDPTLHTDIKAKKVLKEELQSKLWDDKYQSEQHVILPRRQKLSTLISPSRSIDTSLSMKPSHSTIILAKMMGDFEKKKKSTQQFYSPSKTSTSTSNSGNNNGIQVGVDNNGQMTIQATLDASSILGTKFGDVDSDEAQQRLINLTDDEIEAAKLQLEDNLKEQLGGIGIDDEQLNGIIKQVHITYEQSIRQQQRDARINAMKKQQQQGSTSSTTTPSSTSSSSTTPPSSSSTTSQQSSPTLTSQSQNINDQPQQPIKTHTLSLTQEEYEQLIDPTTGDFDQAKLQELLQQQGHDILLDDTTQIVDSTQLPLLESLYNDETGQLNQDVAEQVGNLLFNTDLDDVEMTPELLTQMNNYLHEFAQDPHGAEILEHVHNELKEKYGLSEDDDDDSDNVDAL